MDINRFQVLGKFGVPLSCFSIIPENPKATVIIFHGMGEHKERYVNYAKWMAKQDFAVFVHDHRKHGESIDEFDKVGIFTVADKWEYIIDDAHFVVKEARKQVPDSPIVILGHSMGSIIARRYISKYTALPKAAIIMGTLPIYHTMGAFLPLTLAKIVGLFNKTNPSPFLADTLNKPLLKNLDEQKTKFDWLTYDEKNIENYIEDPLCGYAYNPRFYSEFFKGIVDCNSTQTISETRNIPMLFIAGKDDPVGNYGSGVEDVFRLYGGHGFFELTLKLIPENRHEVLNEKKKTTTYKIIQEWIESVI